LKTTRQLAAILAAGLGPSELRDNLQSERLLGSLPLFNRYVGVHGNFECGIAFLDD
jgi:hypothetical protein